LYEDQRLMTMRFLSFFILILCLLVTKANAQSVNTPADSSSTEIEIVNVDKLKAIDSLKFKKLIGNVILIQDDGTFKCDSAYLYEEDNSIQAFGNVHIQQGDSVNIYADRLKYDGTTRFARLYNNVELSDSKTTINSDTLYYYLNERRALLFYGVDISDGAVDIFADSVEYLSLVKKAIFYNNASLTQDSLNIKADQMQYDFNTNIGIYSGNGVMTNKQTILKSDNGLYDSDAQIATFEEKVFVKDESYEINTQKLIYNLKTEQAEFDGPTIINSDGRNIETTKGSFDQKNNSVSLTGRSTLDEAPQFLTADTLYFEQDSGWGVARGNVYWEDTSENVSLRSAFMRYNQDSSSIVAYQDLMLTQVVGEDTLFLIADTLIRGSYQDSSDLFAAIKNVQLYKSDFQGVCDSLSYNTFDSTFRMYVNPVVWFDSTQLFADTLFLETSDGGPSHLDLNKNAWIISEVETGIYHQLTGNAIDGQFLDGELSVINVVKDSKSIYFAQDEEKAFIGANKANSQSMRILFDEGEISSIKFYGTPNAVFDPIKSIDPFNHQLEGFQWLEERRPLIEYFIVEK